jgi:hypothetical protein
MSLVDDLLNITETMGSSVERVVSYQEAYTLLLRSLLEIRQLNYQIAVLQDKQNDNRTNTKD